MFKTKASKTQFSGIENKKYHTVFWIILAVFFVSLLPLLYIGRYNFPSADDYSNAYKVANIVREGYSPIEAIFVAVAQMYQYWQGTFFASVLIYFNPTMLNYRVYKFVPIITYSLFVFSTMFFSRKAVRIVDKHFARYNRFQARWKGFIGGQAVQYT
ncbi:MAG: hypothetical protein RSA20_03725 [Oscillospiraceae bacterium]